MRIALNTVEIKIDRPRKNNKKAKKPYKVEIMKKITITPACTI